VAKYLRAEKGQRDKYVWMYSEEDSSGQNKILYTNSKQIEAFYKGHVLYPANGMQGGLIGNFGFGIAENDCQICFATMYVTRAPTPLLLIQTPSEGRSGAPTPRPHALCIAR